MSAEHNDFILEFGIGAGNFRDGVEAVFVITGKFGVNVEFDVYRDAGFQEAIYAAIIFNGGDRDGNGVGVFALKDKKTEPSVGVVENSAAGAAAKAAVAAGSDGSDGVFRREEATDFLAEGLTFEKVREREAVAEARGVGGDALEVGVFVPDEKGLVNGLDLAHFTQEDNFSGELAFVFVEVRF